MTDIETLGSFYGQPSFDANSIDDTDGAAGCSVFCWFHQKPIHTFDWPILSYWLLFDWSSYNHQSFLTSKMRCAQIKWPTRVPDIVLSIQSHSNQSVGLNLLSWNDPNFGHDQFKNGYQDRIPAHRFPNIMLNVQGKVVVVLNRWVIIKLKA